MALIESWFLKALGLALIGLATYFLFQADKVAAATVSAALGLLLTFLARISQFKRFKGWGFEAEMWEDKQIEAVKLIEALKNVATLTAREVMLQSVKSGRWGGAKRWQDHWLLFDEIKAAQAGLLDDKSIKTIKKSVDRWFLFDMVHGEFGKLQEAVNQGKQAASQKISTKFGSPVVDIAGYHSEIEKLSSIPSTRDGLLTMAGQASLIETIEKWWASAVAILASFEVTIEMPSGTAEKLAIYKALESLPEMPITADLISAADG